MLAFSLLFFCFLTFLLFHPFSAGTGQYLAFPATRNRREAGLKSYSRSASPLLLCFYFYAAVIPGCQKANLPVSARKDTFL